MEPTETKELVEPEPIEIRKLDKLETTVRSNPSGN